MIKHQQLVGSLRVQPIRGSPNLLVAELTPRDLFHHGNGPIGSIRG